MVFNFIIEDLLFNYLQTFFILSIIYEFTIFPIPQSYSYVFYSSYHIQSRLKANFPYNLPEFLDNIYLLSAQ